MLSPNAQPEEARSRSFTDRPPQRIGGARVSDIRYRKISINGGRWTSISATSTGAIAVEPMKFTETSSSVDVMATVNGGGVGGQSGALRMGFPARSPSFNPELRAGLRKNGFLTRDSRMKERKKYGQKGPVSASSSASASHRVVCGSAEAAPRLTVLPVRLAGRTNSRPARSWHPGTGSKRSSPE